MKLPARPHFFTQLSTHLTKIPQFNWRRSKTSGPVPNPEWQQHQRAWEPVQTLEQEESYSTPEEQQSDAFLNSTPQVEVRLLSAPPATYTSVEQEFMEICDEHLDIGERSTRMLPSIKTDKVFVRTVTTAAETRQITGSLRRANDTDYHLPSAKSRVTPNYEFAIVPRRTAQLPLNEHKLSVFELVNAAIVTFHVEQHRLPHRITIAAIRYWQYRISLHTFDPDNFYYDDMPIPITGAPIGEFGIDEVRLD